MEVCSCLKGWGIIQTGNNTFIGGARLAMNELRILQYKRLYLFYA